MVIKCCHQCHTPLPPGRPKFCSNGCKDRFHNLHNPRGRFAHLRDRDEDFDYGHPFESGLDGHGQE